MSRKLPKFKPKTPLPRKAIPKEGKSLKGIIESIEKNVTYTIRGGETETITLLMIKGSYGNEKESRYLTYFPMQLGRDLIGIEVSYSFDSNLRNQPRFSIVPKLTNKKVGKPSYERIYDFSEEDKMLNMHKTAQKILQDYWDTKRF